MIRTRSLTVAAASLALAACAAGRLPGSGTTAMMGPADAELQTYRIRSWSAPNDDTLIVESIGGERYRAEFMGSCLGLRFTETLGFVTRGRTAIDEFSGIVLPDGTRCTFRSFERIPSPQRSAEAED